MNSAADTIFAVSSGAGKAGVAVVRLSGPGSAAALEALTGGVPEPRRASVKSIRDRNGETIDRGLILWLPGPGSFTGEDMAEFQVHGGRSVVGGLLGALSELRGLRPAEAGEFARRAFANGKLDLTEVEALADLIDAETALQRRQAVRQLEGHAGRVFEDWRQRLIGAIALCEAGIDFIDEEDVPDQVGADIAPIIAHLRGEMEAELSDEGRGEAIREGMTVVIAGPPNAGKSSLMNALARRDVAIVSETPGTTRDAIEVRLDIGGVAVSVVDTAGIRETGDAIELEGVRRAESHASRADLVLWLSEAGMDSEPEWKFAVPIWRLETKLDLRSDVRAGRRSDAGFGVSAKTGAGLEDLLGGLRDWIENRIGADSEPVITRIRHRKELSEAVAGFERAEKLDYSVEPDLVAEELRGSAYALGRITGRIDVEDVLDAIFRDFCIGK